MTLQSVTSSKIADILWPPKDTSDHMLGRFNRLALMTAMLSVLFEKATKLSRYGIEQNYELAIWAAVISLTLPFVLVEKYSRIAVLVFVLLLLPIALTRWVTLANHSWLALWTIPVALLFVKFWKAPLYSDYLRITLGVVMLAAFAQKVLAGTYWDGSYIAYLSYYGSHTERMFQFLCTQSTLQVPCGWHRFIGIFLLGWQFAVGILLIIGVRSLLFLAIEIGFLLGAGLYADEMNFQVLNISLLCLAFGVGMSYRLFAFCVALLVIDLFGIGEIFEHAF